MQWKHALVISAALFLIAVAILPRTQAPAYGHNGEHSDKCVHYIYNFPDTDDEEVARIYATTQIVTVYLEEKGTSGYSSISVLIEAVKNALD